MEYLGCRRGLAHQGLQFRLRYVHIQEALLISQPYLGCRPLCVQ